MIEKTNEEWRDIPGFEGLYKVSNKGEVKSLNYNHTRKEKVLKPVKDKYGYFRIILHKEGKKKNYYIHRLVAYAFLQNPDNLPQVNHKNECKTDNRLENLEFCDAKYNSNYGTRNERVSKTHINGKKSKSVMCIDTGKIYPSTREIQRQFGFAQSHISSCCLGKLKSCYGYRWKYV